MPMPYRSALPFIGHSIRTRVTPSARSANGMAEVGEIELLNRRAARKTKARGTVNGCSKRREIMLDSVYMI
jgi:hypothetical protein